MVENKQAAGIARRTRNINVPRRCLLLYDSDFDQFDNSMFTRLFDVDSHNMKSMQTTLNFLQKVSNLNSYETIYIHLGANDLSSGKNSKYGLEKVSEMLKLIRQKSALINICVSTQHNSVTGGNNKEMSDYIKAVDDLVRNINRKSNDTILTSNNDFLQRFTTHSEKLTLLSNHGRYKLYIRLKYVLLEAAKSNLRASGSSKNPENTNNER